MEINDYNGAYMPDDDIYAPAARARRLPYVRYSLMIDDINCAKRYAYRRRFPRPGVYAEFADLYNFDELPS